ncbi:MAG: EscU/YscU/HrcU family type III secretion system export apparatus switch protein [Thermoguttaceae bacterium]|nr:EscU/YscU/HrcU family type III secretion system export apparatus switch protein [Thermoguttaceae bacterium]
MAGENRTEKPTPKKIQRAREEGNVPYSRQLTSSILFLALALVFFSGCSGLADRMAAFASVCWGQFEHSSAENLFFTSASRLCEEFTTPLWKLLFCIAAVPFICALIQRGWLFLPKKPLPDPSRLASSGGGKRIFSTEGSWLLFSALIHVAVVSWLVCRCAHDLTIPDSESAAVRILTASLEQTSFRLGGILLIFAGGDLIYRRWRWNRSMMMTPEDIRQERREAEGKPEVKAVRNDLLAASRSRR